MSLPFEPRWLAVPFMCLVVLMIMLGNCLVIVAVFTSRALRQAQNFLLVSLASADMAVGILVVPLQVKCFIAGRRWLLPQFVCTIFTTLDVFFCTASILNLAAIAVDRYCAIRYPIAYANRRTLATVLVMIAVAFGLSGVICVGPILGLRRRHDGAEAGGNSSGGESAATTNASCALPNSFGYVVFSAMGSFYIPAPLILSLYVQIYITLRRRLRRRDKESAVGRYSLGISGIGLSDERSSAATATAAASIAAPAAALASSPSQVSAVASHHLLAGKARARQRISLMRERRSLRTLGIVLGVFVLCWLPFFVLYLAGAWGQAPVWAFDLAVWLGYVNSALNPVIYTVFNEDFRREFARLLRLSRQPSATDGRDWRRQRRER